MTPLTFKFQWVRVGFLKSILRAKFVTYARSYLALSIFFAGCSSHLDSQSVSNPGYGVTVYNNAAIENTQWQVTESFMPSPCAESDTGEVCAQYIVQKSFTSSFKFLFSTNQQMSITGGCNAIRALYFVNAGSFSIASATSTLMGCSNATLSAEEQTLQLIFYRARFVDVSGNFMALKTAKGSVLTLKRIQ